MLVTGIGITSAIGQGKDAFTPALLAAEHNFGVMQREGRQIPSPDGGVDSAFLGAEIPNLAMPDSVPRSLVRTLSYTGQVALASVYEAWHDAQLDDVDPERIGLVVGGSNFQQRELNNLYQKYEGKVPFVRPTYAMSFFDSDVCGICTEVLGIKGPAYTIGGASASGQVSVIQAIQAVQSGMVDVCIAVGAMLDLSYWECQGFRSIGAMGSDNFADRPDLACRPYDQDRNGFIFGEGCGVIVVEREDLNRSGVRSSVKPYARLSGWAMGMDGNRNPNPSFEGEVNVIEKALAMAKLTPQDIDYVTPHGTGSNIGDETELGALKHCDLTHAYLNTTKSITGHGLTSAGAIELVATLLQMKEGKLHPCRNLDNPMSDEFKFVRETTSHQIDNAIKMSMGFGGVNTAICLQRY